jgi:hypothetical protein
MFLAVTNGLNASQYTEITKAIFSSVIRSFVTFLHPLNLGILFIHFHNFIFYYGDYSQNNWVT